MNKHIFISHGVNDTENFALRLANLLPPGIVIKLTGDLGAGKTTFTRGLALGLHINETIQSPTFNIMKIYLKGDRPLIHIDAYRLADNNPDIGLDEFIGYETGITVIEWPEFIENLLPSDCLEISIKNDGDDKRTITLISNDETLLRSLQND